MACEISTGDELLLTEMIFNGAFNNLTVEQTVALLSCFVFEEKVRTPWPSAGDAICRQELTTVGLPRCRASGPQNDEAPKLKEELAAPLRMMQARAARRAAALLQCRPR